MIWFCTKCESEINAEKHPDLCPYCFAPSHHVIPKKEQPKPEEKKGE